MMRHRSVLVFLGLLTSLGPVASVPAQGPLGNAGVTPPWAKVYGKSYAEWSTLWWQWVASIPYDQNPVFDATGANAGTGQPGQVFFLAGTAGGSATRSVVIPTGAHVLCPLVNYMNDYPCPDPGFQPAPGQSLEDFLTEGANWLISHATELECVRDGVPLVNLFSYRATSKLFQFTGDPSLTAVWDPCITGQLQDGVSDGYWVMLQPMTPGQHTLTLRGRLEFPEFGGFVFESQVTYLITVLP